MYPSISPLFGQAPKDIRIKYLSSLPISELCKSGQVCKEWFKLAREKVIWVPIFTQLNPLSNRQFTADKEEDVASEVLRDLQSNQKRADLIISLISTDEQLAFIDKTLSLIDLRSMLPVERTMHVMRGLRKDCTQLLVHLIKKYKHDFCEQVVNLGVSDFHQLDKSLPCWLDLVNSSAGPYDAAVVMSAAWSLCLSNTLQSEVFSTLAMIVKSHPNLSSFFEMRVHFGDSPEGQKFLAMTTVVSCVLMPTMAQLGFDVPIDDWIQCGYTPDN